MNNVLPIYHCHKVPLEATSIRLIYVLPALTKAVGVYKAGFGVVSALMAYEV